MNNQSSSRSNSSNQLLVPGVAQALDQMKYEIATEFGVNLGAETTSRANGSVGEKSQNALFKWLNNSLAAVLSNKAR